MTFPALAKLATLVGLALALTGCVDATLEVAPTSETTAKATLTEVMSAEFYAMIKPAPAKIDATGAVEAGPEVNHFCADGALTENTDGTATCLLSGEGPFAGLALGRHQNRLSFASAGPGLVRVSLATKSLVNETGATYGTDEEARQMNESFFSGHTLTVHFGGGEIVDTNMTLSKDKMSAEQVIQFLDLIHGTAKLPPSLFAVVRIK